MEFRFRLSDDEDVDDQAILAAEAHYQAHLSGVDFSGAGDLERYFRRDFFHDGLITAVGFDSRMHDLVVDIDSYSFWLDGYREPALGGDPVAFRCTFAGVAWMELATRRIDDLNDPLDESEDTVEFMRSEIDGLPEHIATYDLNYGVPHHSLVIETLTGERKLALVFRHVTVAPHDQAVFDSLLANPRVWTGLYPERAID
ncbi:MAG: hypothetical protein ISP10_01020 [Aeromicrobium sp.]|nr:hypothetical protein [Aeromicrobium sp.]